MTTITIPFDTQKLEHDDVYALADLAKTEEPGCVTIELDDLDEEELEGITKIAAAACTNPDVICALAVEFEARTNPEAGEATACDPAIIDELTKMEPKASAA